MQFKTMITIVNIALLAIIHGVACCQNGTYCPNISIAVLMEKIPGTAYPFNFERNMGIVEIAMNKSKEILKDTAKLKFIPRYAESNPCTEMEWGALAAEVYHNNEIHAIIGPACSGAVKIVSRMAVTWNLPHFTYVGMSEELADKNQFKMLTRLSFTLNLFAKFYIEVFKTFQWTNIANIYCSNYLSTLVGNSLQRSFDEAGIVSTQVTIDITSPDLRTALVQAMRVSRVFVVACKGDIFRDMVLLAQNIGMNPGEYVFIFWFSLVDDPEVGKYTWERGDKLDKAAKKAYESVMVILPRRPTTEEFFDFEKQAIELSAQLYGYKWPEDAELNVYDIGQHDSFILYALALKDALANGDDPRDGVSVVKRMWNSTFPGIGGTVYISENGDINTNFALLDMEPNTGDWRVVAEYLGYTHKFELLADVPIHWPDNRGPPMDRPVCGFLGDLCSEYSPLPTIYAVVAIALSGVIVLVVAAGVFFHLYKNRELTRQTIIDVCRMKAENAIYSEWWRINWDDIAMQTRFSSFSLRTKKEDGGSRSVFTNTSNVLQTLAVYKGTQVYIKKPKIKSLSVDRKLLIELKQMREITCTNLTRFIGLCPDTNNVCVITEYCSRGSLQDILHNEAIQLDWDFKVSLINDIVQGLYYLHTSPIQVHGRLTSSRCVIDSRFVLKITGFGLRTINNCGAVSRKGKQNNFYYLTTDLLWMAPEHLRVYPTSAFSQPGDIYGFAIILYEMCTRNEPYVTEPWYTSMQTTLNEIKEERTIPKRPYLTDQDMLPEMKKLIEDCWSENPAMRPTIGLVRKTCIALKRGTIHGKNVLDALLHRMEHYANNLEGLVTERTNELLQEKRKSDELLYQVLPKTVADQLRNGQTVVPEAYESVTIFFSDIVGFTNLCALITPFQVVDILNDIYICFDTIIDNFDVYKVETIGDSYMVVSGLPTRNHNAHAKEIARMSLSILEQVEQFIIRHQPDMPLQARVGVHSGPVCAGAVGRKMPRYCLFGDTVNVASRMESNGEAMKIHISESTNLLLKECGTFVTEERGNIKIKGKGQMTTYWLKEELSEC